MKRERFIREAGIVTFFSYKSMFFTNPGPQYRFIDETVSETNVS
jgi:hypothetical protein